MPDLFKSKRHDTAMSPELTLTPPAGTTWTLQDSGVAVRLYARAAGAPSPKISGTCAVTGNWSVRYDPTAEDVDTIGLYDVEVEVTRSNGKKVTFPTVGYLQWQIEADLNNA